MSDFPPLACCWTGDGFDILPHARRSADRYLVVGETYRLVEEHDRSWRSHAHEFAWLREAWRQLPEHLAPEYPTPEHLRKRALIQAGYFDESIVDAGTKAAALRIAAFVRPMDDFALIFVRDCFVIKRTAKSQSRRAMKKTEFQDSKQKIMDIIADMIDVDAGALQDNAERAA